MSIQILQGAVPQVISQHLDDAVMLRATRAVLVRSPHARLLHLERLDERLTAHLDGLQGAGPLADALSRQSLETPGVGQLFVAAVGAIERRDEQRLASLLSLTAAVPDAGRALASAFGWVPAPLLRGIISRLLAGTPEERWVGLAGCLLHRVDPGPVLADFAAHDDVGLRAWALRAAGELGRADLLAACLASARHADAAVRLAATRSALLLGDRGAALAGLQSLARTPGPAQLAALSLLLPAIDTESARAEVRALAQQEAPLRTMLRAAAWAGDTQVMPWLLKHLQDPALTRLAGESFSFITGVDLALIDLERKPPEEIAAGPNDDASDADVRLDEDDGLPWPDPQRIAAWWQTHGTRFASGTRYFMGEQPSTAHCLSVLRTGFQRQRATAAQYLCLLNPGTPLFNIAAPAWRQQRLLASMAS